jgi:3-methyladenine DNA glycosylase AlkD
MDDNILNVKRILILFSNFEKTNILQRFFKTQKGEYGEGDIFIGVTVPDIRKISKKYINLGLKEVKELLYSKIHEERLCALFILVEKFKIIDKKDSSQIKAHFCVTRKEVFNFYIKNIKQINNWDLVDLSAPKIVGEYLLDKPRKLLYDFAKSDNLWEKRISIVATYTFIKNNQFRDTLKIAEVLMNDEHDLIHKAVGWMLREVGKRSLEDEEKFLKKYYKKMPRTMLRYAIEKFPEDKRVSYIRGKI